jgi:hypothetical protein
MRLTRRPCATCKEDTLHMGPKCNTCGAIQPDHGLSREAKMKARYSRYVQKFGFVGASNKLNAEYMADQRAGKALKPITPHHTPPAKGTVRPIFGRGHVAMGARR